MGTFDGIGGVSVSKGGAYFKQGKYSVDILAVKRVMSKVGNKEYFVIETKVRSSNNPEVPVGADRSQVIDMSNVMGLPNVKGFIAAVSGVDPNVDTINDDVEKYWTGILGSFTSFPAVCELVISANNPLEGVSMDLECVEIKKKDGEPFTKHNWFPRQF
jgi:hypothetical protein